MFTITHSAWSTHFNTGMQNAGKFRTQSNAVIMGAVVLFVEHSKNIDYLNGALQYARAHSGMRVNAVESFLKHFTGAKGEKLNGVFEFKKGGRKDFTKVEAEFGALEKWTAWANEHAKETVYDAVKVQSSLVKQLQTKLDKANDEIEKLTVAKAEAEANDDMGSMLDFQAARNHVEQFAQKTQQAIALFG